MKCGNTNDVIHKEVIIIGNGPSGISLSYMLAGNLPYVVSDYHPDEMLSARLRPAVKKCLVNQNLKHLASGLEGRSTNPISLLLDSMLHPCADIGLEMDPLVEFRKSGVEIDHLVLGKGPPGGTWHQMDPYVLTLSLDSWMALPGLPFIARDSGEKRALAHNVAKYYVNYVQQMNLDKYFKNNVLVTNVKPVNEKKDCLKKNSWITKMSDDCSERIKVCLQPETGEHEQKKSKCFITNALNCLLSKATRNTESRCCKRPRNSIRENSPFRKIREIEQIEEHSFLKPNKTRSISLCCDGTVTCDNLYSKSFNDSLILNNTLYSSYNIDNKSVPFTKKCDSSKKWLVHSYDSETGKKTTYSCKYLVLANGASDLPNRLEISRETSDPSWLVYSLRSLEWHLDGHLKENERNVQIMDPVLIVGAGLSAADAVIATRGRNVPVLHVFRNKSADLNKQLPENMYPEYHKVHQMMKDEGSEEYPLYTAYPEHTLTSINEASHSVTLTSKTGEQIKLTVSFAAVLIGSRPDFSFLPSPNNFGMNKNLPVDCKTNAMDINNLTHQVNGYDNLFAIGPLSGDHFVRFIPGGALAVVSELYRQNSYVLGNK